VSLACPGVDVEGGGNQHKLAVMGWPPAHHSSGNRDDRGSRLHIMNHDTGAEGIGHSRSARASRGGSDLFDNKEKKLIVTDMAKRANLQDLLRGADALRGQREVRRGLDQAHS
jgi:hypothetical protein